MIPSLVLYLRNLIVLSNTVLVKRGIKKIYLFIINYELKNNIHFKVSHLHYEYVMKLMLNFGPNSFLCDFFI